MITYKFWQRHCLAIIFFIMVGSFAVFPSVWSALKLGSAYHGFPFLFLDDEDIYLSRIREIIDGHGWVGSPMLYEYKNNVPAVFPVAEYFYALPTLLIGVSLIKVVILSKFLLPSILFLLVYWLVIILTDADGKIVGRQLNAVAAGLAVVLGYDFVDFRYILLLLSGKLVETHLLIWTRLVNPISGGLLLILFLATIWLILEKNIRFSLLTLLSGLLLGLMIGYFFSWAMAVVILGVLFFINLARKRYKTAINLTIIFFSSILLQIPFWWKIFNEITGHASAEFSSRNGIFFTHQPMLNKFVLFATIGFLPFFILEFMQKRYRKEKLAEWWWFCLALLMSGWLVFNQQIITGRTIWPYHFVQYSIPVFFIIIFVFGYNYLLAKSKEKLWLTFSVIVILLSLFYGYHSARSYRFKMDDYRQLQTYVLLWQWLNINAPKDCVVLVLEPEDRLNRLTPALTHCNVYHSTYTFFGVPVDRVLHNYLVLLRLRGITPGQVREYLETHPAEVNTYFFSDWHQSLSSQTTEDTRENIGMIASAYGNFYDKDFIAEIKKYRLDYFLAMTQNREKILKEFGLHPLAVFADVDLYVIK